MNGPATSFTDTMPRWGWALLISALIFSAYQLSREAAYEFVRAQRDHGSDVDVLLSNRVFQQWGFREVEGRIYQWGVTTVPSYKGYPPLPNWGYYGLTLLGLEGISAHRYAMATIAWIGLIISFLAIRRWFDWRYGLGVVVYMATLPFFVRMGAGFHQYPYSFVLWPAMLWAIAHWTACPRQIGRIGLLILIAFLLTLTTYEYVLYSLVVGSGYVYWRGSSRQQLLWLWLWMGVGIGAALGLWYGINILENGWEAFVHDLLYRLQRRTASAPVGIDATRGMLKYLYRFEKELGPGAFVSFGLFLLLRLNHATRSYRWLILILWLGGMSWTVAMFSHAMHHSYFVVVRSYYLPMALTFTYLFIFFYQKWRMNIGHRRIGWGVAMGILVFLQLDRMMEVFALEREELVPGGARQAIEAIVANGSRWKVLYSMHPVEERRVWEYYFVKAADTPITTGILTFPLNISDSLQNYCPHLAMVVSKNNASLFYRLYDPHRGGPISSRLRRVIGNKSLPPPEETHLLLRQMRSCIAYEDARYVLLFPCSCTSILTDAH